MLKCLQSIDNQIDNLKTGQDKTLQFIQEDEVIVSVTSSSDSFNVFAHLRDRTLYKMGTFKHEDRSRLMILLESQLVAFCFNRFRSINATPRLVDEAQALPA